MHVFMLIKGKGLCPVISFISPHPLCLLLQTNFVFTLSRSDKGKKTSGAGGRSKQGKDQSMSDHEAADMSMSDDEKEEGGADMVIDYGHRSMKAGTATGQ